MAIGELNRRDFDGMHMSDGHKEGFIGKVNELIGRANAGGFELLAGSDIDQFDLTEAALEQTFILLTPTTDYIVRDVLAKVLVRFDGAGAVTTLECGTAADPDGFMAATSIRGTLNLYLGTAGTLAGTVVAANTPIQMTVRSDVNVSTLTAGDLYGVAADIALLP